MTVDSDSRMEIKIAYKSKGHESTKGPHGTLEDPEKGPWNVEISIT